jgi:hypothetical protein
MINNFRGNARYPNVTDPQQWQEPDMLVVSVCVCYVPLSLSLSLSLCLSLCLSVSLCRSLG